MFKTMPGGLPPKRTKYQFLEPVRLQRRLVDGSIVDMGYGIGDIIEVMEPHGGYCIPGDPIANIVLSDGSMLINLPTDIDLLPPFRVQCVEFLCKLEEA